MVLLKALNAIPLLLATVAIPAQHRAGLLTGMPPPGLVATSLFPGSQNQVLLRIPAEAYRGLGSYVAPAAYRILGVVLRLVDNTPAEGELFDVHLYLEAGQSNLPTLTATMAPGSTAIASVRDLTTRQGVVFHEIEVLFPSPVDVPIGRDLFVGVHLRSPGLGVRTISGTSVGGITSSLLDASGAGLHPNDYFGIRHDPVLGLLEPFTSGTVGLQPLFDLLVDGPSGVGVAQRGRGQAPTASFFSGLHPDSAQPSHQPNRRDVPGYLFRANGSLRTGSPVFLLASTQPFAWQPWITLSPGNAVIHLSLAGMVSLGMTVTEPDGTALIYWEPPNSPALRGLDVRTQAFGFDTSSGAVAGGAAVRQRF